MFRRIQGLCVQPCRPQAGYRGRERGRDRSGRGAAFTVVVVATVSRMTEAACPRDDGPDSTRPSELYGAHVTGCVSLTLNVALVQNVAALRYTTWYPRVVPGAVPTKVESGASPGSG